MTNNHTLLPQLPELRFEEEKHLYFVNDFEIPSVSALMQPLSSSVYTKVDPLVLNRAAQRGRAVHKSIEQFLLHGVDEDDGEHHAGYFDAFKNWFNSVDILLVGIECRTYHKVLRYGGTIDLICTLNDTLTVIDFKTSAKIEDKLVRVQMEAYTRAFDSHGIKFGKKLVIHLKQSGSYSVMELPLVDMESWEVMGGLLKINSYLNK